MTKETRSRMILYPVALLVLAGLAWGGFMYTAEPDVATLVNSAEILAQAGCYEEAVRNAERALAQDPEARYAHIILAAASGHLGDHARSVEHYERALDLTGPEDEKRSLLRLYLAEARLSSGDHEGAEADCREILAEDGQAYQAWLLLGRVQRDVGRPTEAERSFRKAAAAASGEPEPHVLLASLAEERGEIERALACLDQAVGVAPDVPFVLVRRARLRALAGDREGAVSDLLSLAGSKRAVFARALATVDAFEDLRDDERLVAELPEGTSAPAGETE